MYPGRLERLRLGRLENPGKGRRQTILPEPIALGDRTSSWQQNATWRPVESAEKQRYVSPSRRGNGWYDCVPTTVNLVPNPRTAKIKKTEEAPVSAQALANFRFDDADAITVQKNCKNAGVEPWAVTPRQDWAATPSQWSKAKSASSAASSSFSFRNKYTSSREKGPTIV